MDLVVSCCPLRAHFLHQHQTEEEAGPEEDWGSSRGEAAFAAPPGMADVSTDDDATVWARIAGLPPKATCSPASSALDGSLPAAPAAAAAAAAAATAAAAAAAAAAATQLDERMPSADFALLAQLHLHNPAAGGQRHHCPEAQEMAQHVAGAAAAAGPSPPRHPVIDRFEVCGSWEQEHAQEQGQQQHGGSGSCFASAAHPANGDAWPLGHWTAAEGGAKQRSPGSNCSSPLSDDAMGARDTGAAAHAGRAAKVSLLSRQIAHERTQPGTGPRAGGPSAGPGPEDGGGRQQHGGNLWRRAQEVRGGELAEHVAGLAQPDATKAGARGSKSRQQVVEVIVQVEEASPLRKPHSRNQTRQSKQPGRQQQQQQRALGPGGQDVLCLPRAAQAQMPPPPPQQQQQQQQPQQPQQQEQQQDRLAGEGPQHKGSAAPPRPPRPSSLRRAHELQEQQRAARGGPAFIAQGSPAQQQQQQQQPASVSALVAVSPMAAAVGGSLGGPAPAPSGSLMGLLDCAASSQEAGGWSHQYISGCASALAALAGPGSSRGSPGLLARQDSAADGSLAAAQRAALEAPALAQLQPSQLGAAALGSGGASPPDFPPRLLAPAGWSGGLPSWLAGDGAVGADYTPLGELPGSSDRSLSDALLAAAALSTPPPLPKGSCFDAMDSVSSSSASGLLLVAPRPQWQRSATARSTGIRPPSLAATPGRAGAGVLLGQRVSLSQLLAPAGAGAGAGHAAHCAPGRGVAEQLDALLSGLSLLGERGGAEVAQELAVARSVHEILYHHRQRYVLHIREGSEQAHDVAAAAAGRQRSTLRMRRLKGWLASSLHRAGSVAATALHSLSRGSSSSSSTAAARSPLAAGPPQRSRSLGPGQAGAGAGAGAAGARRARSFGPPAGPGAAAGGAAAGGAVAAGGSSSSGVLGHYSHRVRGCGGGGAGGAALRWK